MLEIRYRKDTKEITAWCGDPEQFGNLNRDPDNETVVILDMTTPQKPLEACLYDEATQTLVNNPAYAPIQPLWFDPENPAFGIEQRVEQIEEFLQEQFPPPS